MALGIDEDPGVAPVERVSRLAADLGAGPPSLLDHRIDLAGRADVVGERHAAPAARVLDAAVLGELVSAPQREDETAGLEEDDVVAGLRARLPAERLVEGARPLEVADAEGDQ